MSVQDQIEKAFGLIDELESQLEVLRKVLKTILSNYKQEVRSGKEKVD